MEELDGMILMAQRSQLQDRREAAAVLQGGDGDVESKISAAVHLMVGPEPYHKWSRIKEVSGRRARYAVVALRCAWMDMCGSTVAPQCNSNVVHCGAICEY